MTTSKGVAIVIPILRRGGGAEKVAAWLSGELDRAGFSVHVATFAERENEYPVAGTRHSLAQHYRGSGWRLIDLAWRLKYLCFKNEIGQLVAFTEEASMVCLISKLLGFRGRVIVAVRNNPLARGFFGRFFIRLGYRLADQVVANSYQMADILKNNFSLKRVVVIENFCDVAGNLIKAAEPVPLDIQKFIAGKFVFLTIGRLIKQKGQSYLLQAFAEVVVNHPAATMIVLGSGVLESDLKKQAVDLGIADKVLFAGVVENVYPIIKAADVFVLPSLWEGLPNALIEALSLGKTVISADCPTGPRELLAVRDLSGPISYPYFATYGVLVACPPVDLGSAMNDAIITKRWSGRYDHSAEAVAPLAPMGISVKWRQLLF